MGILVIDMGTSAVRAAIVHPDATVGQVRRSPLPPSFPSLGLVELDPVAMADAALAVAGSVLGAAPEGVDAVGVTTQRASALIWDNRDGSPLGPGLSWQDLRTAGTCLEKQAEGFRFTPSESATKFAWLMDQIDPRSRAHAVVGTVDSWLLWHLTGGKVHATDVSNAGVTGLYDLESNGWDQVKLAALGLSVEDLPSIVDSSGFLGEVTALPGGLPLCSLVGDQQASLIGQGCTSAGQAKATFGTGGMLDMCLGNRRPERAQRGESGTFPIAAWSRQGSITWGAEAIMLVAGNAVTWLVEDLGLLDDAAQSERVALECEDTDGLVAVPALLGYATPEWDFGARGALFGVSRGTGRPQIVRAVLEGVAHSGADLLEAVERDSGTKVECLRVDGGMSANTVFVQALADACDLPIEVSPQLEATTLGAGFLAGLATGVWAGMDEVAATWVPRAIVEPSGRPNHRERWRRATERAGGWYPELSAIRF